MDFHGIDPIGVVFHNAGVFTSAIESYGFETVKDSRGDRADEGSNVENGCGRFYRVYRRKG